MLHLSNYSFYAKLSDNKNIAAFSNFYDFKFAAIINKNNVFGTQFHLEKSGNSTLHSVKASEVLANVEKAAF